MNSTLGFVYFGGIVLMALFSLLVIFNFVRYRFKGDLTFFFITLFYAAFVIISLSSVLLLRSTVDASINEQEDIFR